MEPTIFQFCPPMTASVEFDGTKLLDPNKFRTRSTGWPNTLSRLLNDLTREAAQNMPPVEDTMATASPPDATVAYVFPNQTCRKNRAHCSAELTPSEPLFNKSSHEDGMEAGSLPVVAGTGGSRRYGRRGGLSLALKGDKVPDAHVAVGPKQVAPLAHLDTRATTDAVKSIEESKAVSKDEGEVSHERSFTVQMVPDSAVRSEEVATSAKEAEQRLGEDDMRAAGTSGNDSASDSVQAGGEVPTGPWQPPPGVVEFRLATSSSSAIRETFMASKETKGRSRKVASALSMLLKGAANSSHSHASAMGAMKGLMAR